MNKRYLSFSKRLSRRILVVFVLTTIIVTLFVATYASMVLRTMATGYFQSELQVANNLVAIQAKEQLFGDERIIDELNRAIAVGQLAPKALIEGMTKAVHAFVGDTEQSDDLTMLCLRYNK